MQPQQFVHIKLKRCSSFGGGGPDVVAGRQDGVVAERQESREELEIRDKGDSRKARHDRPYVEAEDRSMIVGEKRA
jgi:hypothetical protein